MLLAFAQAVEPEKWTDYFERAGLLGAAIFFIWCLLTERIIPGSVHRRLIAEERTRTDNWHALAVGALDRIERAVDAVKP